MAFVHLFGVRPLLRHVSHLREVLLFLPQVLISFSLVKKLNKSHILVDIGIAERGEEGEIWEEITIWIALVNPFV